MEKIDWWFSLWEQYGKRSGLQYWNSRVNKKALIERLQKLEGDDVYITMMRNDFHSKDANTPMFRVTMRDTRDRVPLVDLQTNPNTGTQPANKTARETVDDDVPF